MINLWVLRYDTKPPEIDVLYPNLIRTWKFTKMKPSRCYKVELNPNANGYPNVHASRWAKKKKTIIDVAAI